jgi:tetratricopeptide (TPR) repeat protein
MAIATSKAFNALKPISNAQIDNLDLRFQRDLTKARIEAALGHFDKSLENYEMAVEALDLMNFGKPVYAKGNVFVEMAEIARRNGDKTGEVEAYTKAYEIFDELGMRSAARKIGGHVPRAHRDVIRIRKWMP